MPSQAHVRRAPQRIGLLLGAVGFLVAGPCANDGVPQRGMGRGGMREMMREMMRGVVPSTITPDELPDPQGRGAGLLTAYCTQCHALPSPRMHSAGEWPVVVARMMMRMRMMSRMPMMAGDISAPTADEEAALLDYLKAHGLREASPAMIGRSQAAGAQTFASVCSRCHALPDPAQHTPDEWSGVVERMQRNKQEMGKPPMTQDEQREIVDFLRRAAHRR